MPTNTLVPVPEVPGGSRLFPLSLGRNGHAPDGQRVARAAAMLHMVSGKRRKVLARKSFSYTDALTTAAASPGTAIWRFLAHVSPSLSLSAVECVMVFAPSSNTTSTLRPAAYVTCEPVTNLTTSPITLGAAITQPSFTFNPRNAGTVSPAELTSLYQIWTNLTANTTYAFTVYAVDKSRPIAIMLFEQTSPLLDYSDATHVAVNTGALAKGGSIYDRDMASLLQGADTLWGRQAGHLIGWTVPQGAAVTRSSATYANILDTSVTSYNASTSPGFWVKPQYCAPMGNATAVPAKAYVYANTTAGTAGKAKILYSVGASSAGVTNIGTSLGWYVWDVNLDATQASDKLDFQIACDGVNTLNAYAAGLYQYA